MKFICKNCSYRFEAETDQTSKVCPYCGKMMVEQEPDADDLLKDID
ncbi:hypothetical protein J4225_02190 [Candidatus Pacearchaeota archaeon]|nr:hypothetical protein [Candidatus Pacearchaeota archaeon]